MPLSRFSNSAALLGLVAVYRLDPSLYQQYVGRYEITPDYVLDISFEDYYLVIQPTGQAKTKFFAVCGLVLGQQDFEQKAKKIR